MIAYLKGHLTEKDPTYVTIEVNEVGYHVKISLNTYSQIKGLNNVQLYTHLSIREDAHILYGFFDQAERKRFLELIAISGIGASTALMVLSALTPGELQEAVVTENVAVITGVKGIGLKTAQRLVLELKDQMKKEGWVENTVASVGGSNTLTTEALSALVTLGVGRATAQKNIDAIIKEKGSQIDLEELIKLALRRA